MRHVHLLPYLLAVMSIFGCGKSSDETTVNTENGKTTITQDGSKVVVQTEDGGKTTVDTVKLPEGFPLTLMPGSQLKQANHMAPSEGPEVFQVTANVAGEAKAIADFYDKQLKDKGLKLDRLESNAGEGNEVMLTGNTEKTEAFIAISPEGKSKTCNVVITWTAKK